MVMLSEEGFEDFKHKLIAGNEEKYGEELRAKYGEQDIEESIAYLKGLSKKQYDEVERKRFTLEETLKSAFDTGDPSGELAHQACELHRQWLSVFYPGYSKEYHKGLGEMYAADERFRAYYDKLVPGCAEFLRDAINIYCS
jgi:hypothetical protein